MFPKKKPPVFFKEFIAARISSRVSYFSSSSFLPARACKAPTQRYTSCFVVAVVVAGLIVLYSMKQFDNLTLQQGSHARMQFGILPLQQGNSRRVHAVWYPATASGSLVTFHCSRATAAACMQFGILPLQVTAERLYAV
jgi:hypothetical protein